MQTFCFENFGDAWLSPSKLHYQFVIKFLHAKKQLITHFFLRILQKIANLLFWVIWASQTQLKRYYKFEASFDVYLQPKNELHPSRFPWDIPEILQTCYFRYFGNVWLCTPKVMPNLVENFRIYKQAKNQLHPPCFSEDIPKICKLLILRILGMLGYHTQNM